MKLLINLCAHDGIVSHYAGVGTIVKRYIKCLIKFFRVKNYDYQLNLFTPIYKNTSFGFQKKVQDFNSKQKNTTIYQIENGTDGKTGFGSFQNWEILENNTAKIINNINKSEFDVILTISNDIPFCGLSKYLNLENNHKLIYIPHSTNLIFPTKDNDEIRIKEQCFEKGCINHLNKTQNCFFGAISNFMKQHLIEEYEVNENKVFNIHNGEYFDELEKCKYNKEDLKLFEKINRYESIIFSFGRCEEEKNLEQVMLLKNALKIPTIIITRTYGSYEPILDRYKKTASETKCELFIDPPFDFSKYILEKYNKKMLVVIPSINEPMGLIVNEVRRLNKNNILIAVNNSGGLKEQVTDKNDGIILDLTNLNQSANKIRQFFNQKDMIKFNKNAQKTIHEKYDIYKNFEKLLNVFIGV